MITHTHIHTPQTCAEKESKKLDDRTNICQTQALTHVALLAMTAGHVFSTLETQQSSQGMLMDCVDM